MLVYLIQDPVYCSHYKGGLVFMMLSNHSLLGAASFSKSASLIVHCRHSLFIAKAENEFSLPRCERLNLMTDFEGTIKDH